MKKQEDSHPAWHLIDADNKVLGRLATEVALLLRGKQKPEFVPYLNCGDHVVVINAAKVALTGNKLEQKSFHHHTGYPGGLRETTLKEIMENKPEEAIIRAVKGMLPKNKLQQEWLKRLHVYSGTEHPHAANIAGAAKSDS